MTEQDKTFNEPRLAINRVYTRKGDKGTTSLVGGQKVSKDNLRIDTYGTLDELNACIGMARQAIAADHAGIAGFEALSATLLRVQHELFNLGSVLATLPEDVVPQMPRVTQVDVDALEQSIDAHNESLPPLRSFVLPGGTALNAALHLARTVCRRGERLMVTLSHEESVDEASMAYVNRLSDALFVWSRWASHAAGVPEVLWEPNKGASAQHKP
jgi:cob(I)alamin adenosyltransferase